MWAQPNSYRRDYLRELRHGALRALELADACAIVLFMASLVACSVESGVASGDATLMLLLMTTFGGA
jgi:hypothetical protein